MILKYLKKGYLIHRLPITNTPTLNEKRDYDKMMKEFRKKTIQEHLDNLTILENNYIESYLEQQRVKKAKDELKFRTAIVKVCFNESLKEKSKIKKFERKRVIHKNRLINKQIEKENREKIINIMKKESMTWLNNENLESKINSYLLIPNITFDQTDYYVRLQEKALLHEHGDMENIEKEYYNDDIIAYKNTKLIPVYSLIINIIKKIKNCEVNKLLGEQEYSVLLINKSDISETEKIEKIEKINKIYNNLLLKVSKELQSFNKKINLIEEKLLLIYNLLTEWQKYIGIAKLSKYEVLNLMESETKVQEFLSYESDKDPKQELDDEIDSMLAGNDNYNDMDNEADDIDSMKDFSFSSVNKKMKNSDYGDFINDEELEEKEAKDESDLFLEDLNSCILISISRRTNNKQLQ